MRFAFLACVALLAALAPARVNAAEEKPIPCSLSVSPRPGTSKISNSGGRQISRGTHGPSSSTKTTTRSLNWLAEVRFRNQRPDKAELRVFYLGNNEKNTIIEIGKGRHDLKLDENGRASLELASPTTTMRRVRTVTSSGSRHRGGGAVSSKSTTHGERVTGCIIQVFADGRLSKAWTSDSRWAAESKNADFSVDNLNRRNGKIGLR